MKANEKIKKEITFICTDKVERQCCEPIAEEAARRGYKVTVTDDPMRKCEIGFYLSHVNWPKNSKFSVITLHDLTQQHGEWPVMWRNEFWNDFDVGFLPSKTWSDMWHDASCYAFARPRSGCYLSGWIKADTVLSQDFAKEKERIISHYGIDTSKKTVLYAPSWEWGGRQVEMAEAVRGLDINLIVKQFPLSPDKFPEQVKLITEADEKTRALGLENVFILDTHINIFNAISLCDVLVSEESSTLSEAMLMGKNSIAVTDWLVPDVTPPRKPECNHDFVIKTARGNLRRTIIDVLENKEYEEKIQNYRQTNFPHVGHGAKIVMDVLDNLIGGAENDVPRIEELPLKPAPKEYLRSVARRKRLLRRILFKKTVVGNNKFLLGIWDALKTVKHSIKNKFARYGVGGGDVTCIARYEPAFMEAA